MNYIALGIIGHVDHGKTTLVKALTGTDTDRLKEEKARGISIALGYAHLPLPHGEIGVIDAPGHERFIRTMIAGATGSASALLVVDVNEGVKPQTIEHLDIAELLGMRRGVIAITKCDTADEELLPLVKEEVRELVVGTFMASAPIVETSALSEAELDALRAALDKLLVESTSLTDEGFSYLPIDRVFSMPGFGTVLTGTLRRGTLSVDDKVALYPGGQEATIRALQTHQVATDRIEPGHRCAVNLRGVEKAAIERGNVLASPGSVSSGTSVGVQLTLLENTPAPVKHGQVLRMLFGTQETYPHVYFLDRKTMEPGETCVAELRHDTPIVALNREPFILRAYSPMRTIGGGRILEVSNQKYRRKDASAISYLQQLAEGNPESIANALINANPSTPLKATTFQQYVRLDTSQSRKELDAMSVTWIGDDAVVLSDNYQAIGENVLGALNTFHQENPTRPGVPEAELNALLPTTVEANLLSDILGNLLESEKVALEKGHVRIGTFTVAGALSDADKLLVGQLEKQFKEGGFKPPDLNTVIAGNDARHRIYRYLVDSEILVVTRDRVQNTTIVFHEDAIKMAQQRLTAQFPPPALFSASEARTALDTSRKYVIPLLEFLDSIRFTRRNGDKRQVIAKPQSRIPDDPMSENI